MAGSACITYEELTTVPPDEYEELGHGSFGRAYKVRDYVVKVISIKGPIMYRRFLNEVDNWEALSAIPALKPYMPAYCWSAIHETQAYILQRYEPTETLLEVIETTRDVRGAVVRPLPYNYGTKLFRSLIKGHNELLKAGFLHRDLKPNNILVRKGLDEADEPLWGVPMFIDFGSVCKMPCDEGRLEGTMGYFPSNWVHEGRRTEKYGINVNKNVNGHKGPTKLVSLNETMPRFARKKLLPLKVKANTLPIRYSVKTDQYALAKTLEKLYEVIDWAGHEDQRGRYEKHILHLKGRMIAELAAQRARGETGTDVMARFRGSYFPADPVPTAPVPVATRKRRANGNNRNNTAKRSREGNANNE